MSALATHTDADGDSLAFELDEGSDKQPHVFHTTDTDGACIEVYASAEEARAFAQAILDAVPAPPPPRFALVRGQTHPLTRAEPFVVYGVLDRQTPGRVWDADGDRTGDSRARAEEALALLTAHPEAALLALWEDVNDFVEGYWREVPA